MENESPPEPQQIDLIALLAQTFGPILGQTITMMLSSMGGHAIPCLAGCIGRAFQPVREQLKGFNPEGMPPAMIEFYSGLSAIVDHAHELNNPRIVTPGE